MALHGPGESRTRVLRRINHSVYVRSPPIDVSSGWLVNDPPLDELSRALPRAGKRDAQLARIFDTCEAAPGGLPRRHSQGCNRSYAARAMFELAVEKFPEGFTRNPRTWARDHSFFYTIETISGPTSGKYSGSDKARQATRGPLRGPNSRIAVINPSRTSSATSPGARSCARRSWPDRAPCRPQEREGLPPSRFRCTRPPRTRPSP